MTGDDDAAATPAPDPHPRFRETVTVVAEPLDVPGSSVSVIDRDAIDASGVTTLPELLREVAGVRVDETGSRAGIATAEVRGGDPTFTQVLVDGVLMNDGNDNLGDVYNLASLMVENVERIEIVRGPVSSIYGSRALAGVLHVVTRRARADEGLSGAAELGSFSQRRATLAVGGTRGDADGRLAAGWEREAGRVGDDRYEGATLHVNAGTRAAGRALRLRGRWASTEGDDYPDASGGPVLGDGALRHGESDDGSLSLHWALAEGARRNGLDASLRVRSLRRDSPAIAAVVPASTQDSDLTRWRLAWAGSFALGRGHVLTASTDAERESGRSDNALNLAPGVTLPGRYEMDRTLGGLFVGLSAEVGSLSYAATARVDTPSGHSVQVSPRVSASWGPQGARWRVRASGGRGFKLPSFYALGSPPELGGNPSLAPETSLGGDVGLDLRLARAELALTFYAQRASDVIDFDFDVLQLVNRSRVDSRGIELSGRWSPAAALGVTAAMTYLDSELVGSDDPLLHQPEWTGHASVAWSPVRALRLRLEGHAATESADQQIPVPDRSTLPGYAWLAWGASWRLTSRAFLEGRVANLTDRQYETLIGFPAPGRSFRLGIRIGAAPEGD